MSVFDDVNPQFSTPVPTIESVMGTNRRPILKDVAALAKLSVSAVSLALRNPSALPKSTVERVERAANELGYTPDPGLSALAAYRSRTRVQRDFGVIALVSNWSSRDEWLKRESAQQLLAGATERARALGYTLQHMWSREEDMSSQRFGDILINRGIQGLILAPFFDPSERFDLAWENYAVVTIERPTHHAEFHHVMPNYYMDMVLAWEKAREYGYRRVGLVLDDALAERVAHQWEAAHAFEQYCGKGKGNVIPTLLLKGGDPAAAMGDWIGQHNPDLIISRSENNLPHLMDNVDVRIPEDVGYVNLNVSDDVAGVSGICQPREVMGATAVDILNGLLLVGWKGPGEFSVGTQVAGRWQDGNTLQKRN